MPALQRQTTDIQWFKSSYSGGNTTECVECTGTTASMLVRDSKWSEGPVLSLGVEAWQTFIGGVVTAGRVS
ncbi:DUF397 domain-containing protein [Streptomyces sp. NPDC057271]|uniref:DUF397 domain-containing protein n=1 Tax=unclassified Streptomyces TaxID=2593676 RepID=UPI00362E0E80